MHDEELAHAILTAIFFDEDGGVTAFVEEFISVAAHGRNLMEAGTKLTKAASAFIQTNR